MVADQPYIQSSTMNGMINLIINNHALLGTVKYQQQVGNPTMFHCQLYNELMKLKGDEGGRKIIDKYSSVCLKFLLWIEKNFMIMIIFRISKIMRYKFIELIPFLKLYSKGQKFVFVHSLYRATLDTHCKNSLKYYAHLLISGKYKSQ